MGFASSEEVRRYIGGIFETAFTDEEMRTKLVDTGLVLRFSFSDPDTDIVIDLGAAQVLPEGTEVAPAATVVMTAETGNAYWQGKVNLPLAMAKRKIKVDGNISGLLKLAPLAKKLYPVYVETLRQDGRDDLVA